MLTTNKAYGVMHRLLSSFWSDPLLIRFWMSEWHRTKPVAGDTMKSIIQNFLRLMTRSMEDLVMTERAIFPFGLEYPTVCFPYNKLTVDQHAHVAVVCALSGKIFKRYLPTDREFLERGFVLREPRNIRALPYFPCEEFTRIYCIMLLEKSKRVLPTLISAYDGLLHGDHLYNHLNPEFFHLLYRSLQTYDPVDSLREMLYMPWEAKPTTAAITTTTTTEKRETERARRRRLAREARETEMYEAYQQHESQRHITDFGNTHAFLQMSKWKK